MMEWSSGYSATYYAYIIDPVSWRETTRLEITGGSINRTSAGLRDSADIECTGYQSAEQYIRVYLDVVQAGESVHEAIFTGLATSPSRDIDGNYERNTLACYSVLKAANDVLLRRGYYVPAGMNGALAITDLLSVIPAPVTAEGSAPGLQFAIIAEEGETRLSMADKVLDAIGWRMRITGDGTVVLAPKATEAAAQFDPLDHDVLEPSITVNYDWFDCPNVFRAVAEDLSAVARDDDPDSPLSTVSRGREVWAEETSCDLNTGESISEYAVRRLKELQTVRLTAGYSRRYDPGVLVGDLVRLRYPAQGLDGLYRVTSQSVSLSYGASTTEEVEAV